MGVSELVPQLREPLDRAGQALEDLPVSLASAS